MFGIVIGCLICEADAKRNKIAKDILLWKIKASIKGVDGGVFRNYVIADFDDKVQKKHEDDIANAVANATAKAEPKARGGLMGMFV